MKIGVLIPTQGTRFNFLKHSLKMLKNQTLQPDFVKIVDDYTGMKYDLTWRYKQGIKRLKEKGADVIIFWEEDDWYSKYYIELMVQEWVNYSKPDVFGLSSTLYYHIGRKEYINLEHPRRASMMNTIVNSNIDISGFRDHDINLDINIWNNNNYTRRAIDIIPKISIGIKHGEGNCGGNGHKNTFKYDNKDNELNYLESITDSESFKFYKQWHIKHK